MSEAPAQQSTNAQARDELRKHLISSRCQLSDAQVLEYSATICTSLLPLIKPSANVAGYLAIGSEVRIDVAMKIARQRLCDTYVPIMQSARKLVFAKIDDDMPLVKNNFGIQEPNLETTPSISSDELDIVLVPLVGFDEHCQRMGMGGGYYDRAFAKNKSAPESLKKPLLIGMAYDIQQAPSVMPDWWDVPLDLIVTETRIIRPALPHP